jgi:hypothetical protein
VSKTYKRIPSSLFRHPKGYKQAKINNVRSIPPNAWDDIQTDKQCWMPFDIARNLYKQNKTIEDIRKTLIKKFNLKNWEINQVLSYLEK